jgi:hypothetical protein
MSRLVVVEVHGQAVVDHDATEGAEHSRFVGGILASGGAGEQVGVELVGYHVEPPLVRLDLVGGLIDVDKGGVSQPLADLLDEAGEASGCLSSEGGDEPGGDVCSEHGRHGLGCPLDREMLTVEEIEGGGPDVGSVAGRGGGLPREHTSVQRPA